MKKHLAIVLLIFILFPKISYSKDRVKILQDSIDKYFYTNPEKSKFFCHSLLRVSEIDQLRQTKVLTYCYLSYLSNVLNQKDSVFYYYDKGIQQAKESQDQNLEKIVKVNKAKYLFDQFDYDGSLTLFNECLSLAKELKDVETMNYILLQKAGILYELERYEDALVIYQESLKKNHTKRDIQLDIELGLVKTYIKLNKSDVAHTYIIKALQEAKKYNLKEYELLFLLQYANYYTDKKAYKQAEQALDHALKIAETSQNKYLITSVKISLSRLYTTQQLYSKAITLLEQALHSGKDILPIEYLSEIYYLLGENYKFVEDMSQSNYYFDLFIKSSKKIGQKKIEALDYMHKINVQELEEGERLQEQYKWIFTFISIFLILVLVLFVYRKKQIEKTEKLKFEALLLKIQKYEESLPKATTESSFIGNAEGVQGIIQLEDNSTVISPESITNENSNEELNETAFGSETELEEGIVLKTELIDDILDKLLRLEEKKLFLRQDFTLHNVAKRLKTNTAYLSKIINNELGKSFSTYVNELRINYIIIELKNNAKLRSYSVQGIANEIGYKSTESFTKYFKIATGISPATYIKNINLLAKKTSNF